MAGLADLLFPSSCVGCERPVRGGLCHRCLEAIPRLGPCACSSCGAPVQVPASECKDCRGRGHHFDSARQAVEFGSTIRKAIHNFKYRTERSLGDALALLLTDLVDPEFQGIVTWVPAGGDRLLRRGFDHGKVLSQSLGISIGKPATQTLRRVRRTLPQMGLEPDFRRRNLLGAFEASPLRGEVLVVDDVFTTGATASEAARALKAAGASSVDVVCVARAVARQARPGPGGFSRPGAAHRPAGSKSF